MHINGWSWKTERSVPSKNGASRRIIHDVLSKLRDSGWSREEIFGVHLALEEGLMNAIKHGNGSDASKRVFLRCNLSPDRIWIEIRDEGAGFNPDELPDCTEAENLHTASGRGVMLMRAYMSRVEFNESGNCVTMEKLRSNRAAS
jgi:serine/threonine-protein kinase RsbW